MDTITIKYHGISLDFADFICQAIFLFFYLSQYKYIIIYNKL